MPTNRRTVLKSALGLSAAIALPSVSLGAARPKVVATPVGERVLVITGLGNTVVAVRGDEGLLLIDSGAPGETRKLQSELKQFARRSKVQAVINTHWHAESSGGNEVFAKEGAKLVAHAKCAQRMAVDQYVPWEDRYQKARDKAAVPKDVFYVGSKELQFGGERIEYGYLQQPHTDGDIYVWLRDADVLVAGDAVSPVADPKICWFEGGWVGGRIDSQAKLLKLAGEQTRIVSATGGLVGRAAVQTEHDALVTMFDRVSDAMRKGFTTEDMQNGKLLDGLPRTWADPDQALYDAHKSMWAHYNKLSHSIV